MQKISDDEAWLVLLIIILQQDSSRVAKLWSDFESEIKYNNRFFPNTEILKEIEKLKEQSQYEEVKGTILFRARLFEEDFLNYNKRDKEQLIEILCNHYPDLKGKADDEINYYLTNMKDILSKNDGLKDELRKVLKKRKRYWGYGPGDSDAPPTIVASDGRVNPRYISYLYLSTDVKTAILEVRPYVGQQVSVARVRLEKDLRLFNFCNDFCIFRHFADIHCKHYVSRILFCCSNYDRRVHYTFLIEQISIRCISAYNIRSLQNSVQILTSFKVPVYNCHGNTDIHSHLSKINTYLAASDDRHIIYALGVIFHFLKEHQRIFG